MFINDEDVIDSNVAEAEKELAALFKEEIESSQAQSTQAQTAPTTAPKTEEVKDTTKAFSIRLNQEREKIAKEAGFESYSDMLKKREEQKIKDAGIDPEVGKPLIDSLAQSKIESDPRLKELEVLRKEKKEREFKEWVARELEGLKTLTDGEIDVITKVPADVMKLSEKTGSLKSAYMQLHGEELLKKVKVRQIAADSKGTTSHMIEPGMAGTGVQNRTRPLNESERKAYKMIMGNKITDAELDKMSKPV